MIYAYSTKVQKLEMSRKTNIDIIIIFVRVRQFRKNSDFWNLLAISEIFSAPGTQFLKFCQQPVLSGTQDFKILMGTRVPLMPNSANKKNFFEKSIFREILMAN